MNNNIPAVEKTIALLDYMAGRQERVSQAQLKKELGISMSTTYRILQTLLDYNWVVKHSNGTYELGNGLLPLLCSFRGGMKMLENFQSVIDRTARNFDIACKISIRRGDEQVTLMRAEPDAPVVLTGKTGSHFPVIEGSVGAALLCDETAPIIDELIKHCQVDIPERNNPDILFDGIENIRTRGYALNRNNRWRISALSSPIHDRERMVIAAITFVVPELEISSEKLNNLGGILMEAARECEKCL